VRVLVVIVACISAMHAGMMPMGGGGWVGTAESDLNMSSYRVYGASDVVFLNNLFVRPVLPDGNAGLNMYDVMKLRKYSGSLDHVYWGTMYSSTWSHDLATGVDTYYGRSMVIRAPLTSTHVIIARNNGSTLFRVFHSTFGGTTANTGMAIATTNVLGAGTRGIWIDYGDDDPSYRGNVIVGELSAGDYMRPHARLGVKGSFYVGSGYNGESITMWGSASGAHINAGSAGLELACNGNTGMEIDSNGWVYITSVAATSSYSLMRIDPATGRVYRDSSVRAGKANIRDYGAGNEVGRITVRRYRDRVSGRDEIGLIAEELERAGIGDLVVRDSRGRVVGVAYERVALLLIPVVQDHHRRIERLETAVIALSSGTLADYIRDGQANVSGILAALAALASGIGGVMVGSRIRGRR